MALRRQRLAQRRKAMGLTQESLAHQLGVERSTVVRWEAGDTEPLPSVRPNMARALQVSIDQLAELLATSEHTETALALLADPEERMPVPLPAVEVQGRPSRTEFEDLIRPQVAETVEALRRVLQSAGVSPEDLDQMLLVGRCSGVPPVARPASAACSRPATVDADLPIAGVDVRQRDRARSLRFKRFAAAGAFALVLAAGAVVVPFTASRGGPFPPAAAGTPAAAAPLDAAPAPSPGNGSRSGDSTAAVPVTPAAAPDKRAGRAATPASAVMPAAQIARATSRSLATRWPEPRVSPMPAPPPRTPAWGVAASLASSHRGDGVNWVDQMNQPGLP